MYSNCLFRSARQLLIALICTVITSYDAQAVEYKNLISGTSWKMYYCICDKNSKNWDFEGEITFLNDGTVKDCMKSEEPKSCTWTLRGKTLEVGRFGNHYDFRHGINANVEKNKMEGRITLGMNPRDFKFRAVRMK